jgi:hypothetical protein
MIANYVTGQSEEEQIKEVFRMINEVRTLSCCLKRAGLGTASMSSPSSPSSSFLCRVPFCGPSVRGPHVPRCEIRTAAARDQMGDDEEEDMLHNQKSAEDAEDAEDEDEDEEDESVTLKELISFMDKVDCTGQFASALQYNALVYHHTTPTQYQDRVR